jgi:hypothetical protein
VIPRVLSFLLAGGILCAAEPGFAHFDTKVKEYTALVDRLDRDAGKLHNRSEADEVNAHKRALADAIAKGRPAARPGEFFTPAERAEIVRIVRSQTAGRGGAPARKAILEDNPKTAKDTPRVALAPNAVYPDGAPLSTVPPRLLLRLPALPKTLDYRFVGKALVLHDVRANLIVDYIPDALP